MFNTDFYFQSIRKYVTLFGTLFSEINITRANSANTVNQYIKIPITYAQGEKMLTIVESAIDADRASAAITLPVMSFEMTSITYDGDRKLASTGRSAYMHPTIPSRLKYQYNPVPYDIGFQLVIWTKNVEDGTKIVEQILPSFTPHFTVRVNMIEETGDLIDLPIILNSVHHKDQYETDLKKNQPIIWTLDFTIKGQFWGPVKSAPIILFSNTNFRIPATDTAAEGVGNTDIAVWTSVQPGQTANGEATNDIYLSVPPNTIFANSDFGYITTYGRELGEPIIISADYSTFTADNSHLTADQYFLHRVDLLSTVFGFSLDFTHPENSQYIGLI